MVHFLLHLGATTGINLIDADGNTALHYAALHCPAEYVEVLYISLFSADGVVSVYCFVVPTFLSETRKIDSQSRKLRYLSMLHMCSCFLETKER